MAHLQGEVDVLTVVERDMIFLALRGDVDMRRYAPEVKALCEKYGVKQPPWMQEPDVVERLKLGL